MHSPQGAPGKVLDAGMWMGQLWRSWAGFPWAGLWWMSHWAVCSGWDVQSSLCPPCSGLAGYTLQVWHIPGNPSSTGAVSEHTQTHWASGAPEFRVFIWLWISSCNPWTSICSVPLSPSTLSLQVTAPFLPSAGSSRNQINSGHMNISALQICCNSFVFPIYVWGKPAEMYLTASSFSKCVRIWNVDLKPRYQMCQWGRTGPLDLQTNQAAKSDISFYSQNSPAIYHNHLLLSPLSLLIFRILQTTWNVFWNLKKVLENSGQGKTRCWEGAFPQLIKNRFWCRSWLWSFLYLPQE